MENRDLDSTYDPRKPWHIIGMRQGRYGTISTHDEATEVVTTVMQMPAPERVIVWHVPSDHNGTGDKFLAEVNRRMSDNG